METAPLWKCCPPPPARNKTAVCASSGGFRTSSAPQAKNLQAVAMRIVSQQGGRPMQREPAAAVTRHAPPLPASLLETSWQPDWQQLWSEGKPPLCPGTSVSEMSFAAQVQTVAGLCPGRSTSVSTLWFPRKQDPGPLRAQTRAPSQLRCFLLTSPTPQYAPRPHNDLPVPPSGSDGAQAASRHGLVNLTLWGQVCALATLAYRTRTLHTCARVKEETSPGDTS